MVDQINTPDTRRDQRIEKACTIANAIATRSNGQIAPGALLLAQVGHDADTTALWNTLIALRLVTNEEREEALDQAYDAILEKVREAAPRILMAGSH